jgi:hypothetical protein
MRWKTESAVGTRPANLKRQHTRLPFTGSARLYWIEDGRACELRASLVNASEGGMAVTARTQLPVGAQVWILLQDGTDGRAEVRYSNPRGTDYQTGLRFIAEERRMGVQGSARSVLEWIDASNDLVGASVSVRNAREGDLDVTIPEVVPCPKIVMLTAHGVRCLCCTRDWSPHGDLYRFRIEVVSMAFPNNSAA